MAEKKIAVSVKSLGETQFSGWGTKQGGKIKSWKRRYFVLKDRKLWYFEDEKSTVAKGWIDLPPGTEVKDESTAKQCMLSINSRGVKGIRTFHITVETPDKLQEFMNGVNIVLGNVRVKKPQKPKTQTTDLKLTQNINQLSGPENMLNLKSIIKWINESHEIRSLYDTCKIALPQDSSKVAYQVKVNSNCENISLRFEGEQVEMLQSIVDTFWAVGTPPSEIERLNQSGIQIDPDTLGMWIDLTKSGGMDGGWFMPTDKSLMAIPRFTDGGVMNDKNYMLLQSNGIERICYIGRDMGTTPPRQTEFRFKVSGNERGHIVKDLLDKNKIKSFNSLIQKLVTDAPTREVTCSVKTTNFDLVKFTTIIQAPSEQIFTELTQLVKDFDFDLHNKLIEEFGNPVALEISYLQPGFGYEVFVEGLDVSLVYNLQHPSYCTLKTSLTEIPEVKYVYTETQESEGHEEKKMMPKPKGNAPPKPSGAPLTSPMKKAPSKPPTKPRTKSSAPHMAPPIA